LVQLVGGKAELRCYFSSEKKRKQLSQVNSTPGEELGCEFGLEPGRAIANFHRSEWIILACM
jgi:hypothetical protein